MVLGSRPWLHSEQPGPGLRTLDPDPSLARPSCVTLGNALRVYLCIYQMGETRVLEGIVTIRMKLQKGLETLKLFTDIRNYE